MIQELTISLEESYSKYNKLMEEYENMRDMYDGVREEFEEYVRRKAGDNAGGKGSGSNTHVGSQNNIGGNSNNAQQGSAKKKSKFGGFLGF